MELPLSKNTYKSKITEFKLQQGLFVALFSNHTQATDTFFREINKKYLQLYFCTKGKISFSMGEETKKEVFKTKHAVLLHHPSENLPLNLLVHPNSELFVMAISTHKTEEILPEINQFLSQRRTEKTLVELLEISTSIFQALGQIKQTSLQNNYKNLYQTAKTFEVLSLFFDLLQENSNPRNPENQVEVKHIKKVKELLSQNLFSPPSMEELCTQTGLSPYKLTHGFKRLFGDTPYGYILNKKLEIGKELLEENIIQVKDVAFKLGYENPSHFILAFKKKYGITPKQYLKEQV
ncbi:MAG: AraC family transcriptional regulator [Flavobacteriaceae bacterium]|nr:MAG: AraC family transcriptional regulator [Flavobacteriaceae bacterium]